MAEARISETVETLAKNVTCLHTLVKYAVLYANDFIECNVTRADSGDRAV
jgi:hypothetical protein